MGQDNLICPCSCIPVHCNVDYIAHRTGKCILIYYITILIRKYQSSGYPEHPLNSMSQQYLLSMDNVGGNAVVEP